MAAEKQYQLGIGPVIGLGNLGSRDLIQGSLSSRSKKPSLENNPSRWAAVCYNWFYICPVRHGGGGPGRHRPDRTMTRIGVISDTHGFFDERVPELFADVNMILHAGDVGGSQILEQLSWVAPVCAVRGNVDTEGACAALPESIQIVTSGFTLFMTHILTLPENGPAAGLPEPAPDVVIFRPQPSAMSPTQERCPVPQPGQCWPPAFQQSAFSEPALHPTRYARSSAARSVTMEGTVIP